METKRPDDVAHTLTKQAQERAKHPGKLWGLSWGEDMPKLNQVTGGIKPRKLYVLISRPNTGKSALAAKWALNVAEAGKRVRIATYEMSAESYQNRIACFMANVPIYRIDQGTASGEELTRYVSAQARLAQMDIEYQESAETFEEMSAFFRADGGCDLGVLDHIGIVPGFYGAQGYSNAASVSIKVSRLAHTTNTLVVLGHQNRESLKGEDKRPTAESVAGSDQITRDADIIFGLYRPDQFTQMAEDQYLLPKPGELLVLKNRDGAAGRVIHMIYEPTRTDWKESPALNGTGKGKGHGRDSTA